MIAWQPAKAERLADPALAVRLLERAVAAAPGNAVLHAKLGNCHLDRFDFGNAAAAFEAALRLDPASAEVRVRLARCWNRVGRHADVLALLADAPAPEALTPEGLAADLSCQQGVAARALGRMAEAEAAFRRTLARDPHHRTACFELGKLLREGGRRADLDALLADLWERGVRHAQLLLDRGRAAAFAGDAELARRLLFDPARVDATTIAPPEAFGDLAAFNAAVAADLTGNRHAITDVPTDELAMRGAARVHHLMNGDRPDLLRALLAAIQAAVDRHMAALVAAAAPDEEPDPWLAARPARARLAPWGLIQKSGDYEDWHTHRGGWLSGVYYIQVPEPFSTAGDGAGCIEFGPPPSLVATGEPPGAPLRIAPREGLLLLCPSHYHHRTIPFVSDRRRISFAFDVCPA
ncbi:tetratricopeptide (TPR) repeat protein [Constrictibacter sp. MBR-5]|jgi:tetratricopeptide (TPR) repeat protein|uniref:putative 2OG-Fe(II) oxygenase n=1 Tax=Constrictibacter sp. MBR-5 TaxID=3156467 RepID=UPI00339AA281